MCIIDKWMVQLFYQVYLALVCVSVHGCPELKPSPVSNCGKAKYLPPASTKSDPPLTLSLPVYVTVKHLSIILLNFSHPENNIP